MSVLISRQCSHLYLQILYRNADGISEEYLHCNDQDLSHKWLAYAISPTKVKRLVKLIFKIST